MTVKWLELIDESTGERYNGDAANGGIVRIEVHKSMSDTLTFTPAFCQTVTCGGGIKWDQDGDGFIEVHVEDEGDYVRKESDPPPEPPPKPGAPLPPPRREPEDEEPVPPDEPLPPPKPGAPLPPPTEPRLPITDEPEPVPPPKPGAPLPPPGQR